jgi:hypothetical protein
MLPLPEAGEGNFNVLYVEKMASHVKNRKIGNPTEFPCIDHLL